MAEELAQALRRERERYEQGVQNMSKQLQLQRQLTERYQLKLKRQESLSAAGATESRRRTARDAARHDDDDDNGDGGVLRSKPSAKRGKRAVQPRPASARTKRGERGAACILHFVGTCVCCCVCVCCVSK